MTKHKALIIDIDGTAIDSPTQKVPTQRLIDATRVIEDEYYVCAATGRTWSTGKPVFQGLSLIDPCVISGGTQICDPRTGEILWQCNVSKSDMEIVKNTLMEYPEYGVIFNDFSQKDYESGGIPVDQLDIEQDMFFIVYPYVPVEVATVIADKLETLQGIKCLLGTSQREGLKDIHITNSSATKEHAITELLTRLKVDRRNTWGFGDALNDVHLFNAVGTKVAMGNAIQELKDQADEVIGSVSEDGLAQYFERLA
jgi:HAD superfamily hydrolase (TIGR01484 family)